MAHKMQNILKEKKTEVIIYCKICHQAVRQRKRDGVWVHYGWKRMHEPYSGFLERTNHPVIIGETREVPISPISVVRED